MTKCNSLNIDYGNSVVNNAWKPIIHILDEFITLIAKTWYASPEKTIQHEIYLFYAGQMIDDLHSIAWIFFNKEKDWI